jgi:tetratricopeptide (TPR) repeat protein
VLDRGESVDLLRHRVPGMTEPDAARLAEALGDLPLAIAQAAAFLAEAKMPAAEYAGLLRRHAAELLDDHKPVGYPATLAAVTTLAYDRLRRADGNAANMAAICAFLAPEPIPAEWPAAGIGRLRLRWKDPVRRARLLARLTSTSLARLDEDGSLSMHRLTQTIVRAHDRTLRRAHLARRARKVVIANVPRATDSPASWPDWARVLPHLLALDPARSGSRRVRKAAAGAAWYLVNSGNAKDALDLARHLLQAWHPDSPTTWRVEDVLGVALRELGHHERARQVDEEHLASRRRERGYGHPYTLRSAHNLAVDLRLLGDYDAARALQQDTLTRRREILGDDNPDTLHSAHNLAVDLRALGDYDAARDLHEDTLARRRRVLGEDHPETLRTMTNLAGDLHQLGEYDAARALDEDTLTRRRRVLGNDHPDTMRAATNLAEDLRALGEYHHARALDEDTLTRRRRVLGDAGRVAVVRGREGLPGLDIEHVHAKTGASTGPLQRRR